MDFQDTPIDGLRIVRMDVFSDERGWFGRSFCQREFADAGMEDIVWTQMNHSFTAERGSIRGLHYQVPPFSEAKLDVRNPDRGPLLIIDGEKDHTVPWAIANASYKRQRHNQAVTEIQKIPNRGHSLTIDSGWREVAQVALDFVRRFV